MDRPRILSADDHTLVAEAFKALLEPEYHVAKLVADGRSLIAVAKELRPDVVLLDLNMPLLNGIDAGLELKTLLPKTKLIVLTMNEDGDYCFQSSAAVGIGLSAQEVRRRRAEKSDIRSLAWALVRYPEHGAEIDG